MSFVLAPLHLPVNEAFSFATIIWGFAAKKTLWKRARRPIARDRTIWSSSRESADVGGAQDQLTTRAAGHISVHW